MKKILPIFGLMTLGTTVPVSIVQNISSNKINNTTQSTFDLNNELSKRKSKCGDDLVIEYKSETNSLGRHVSTLYLDQWLVNAHYDWATREDSGIYNYNRVMYFLELTVPGFAHESDQYVKELITKTLMTESLKYVNKSISGFYVQIENTHFGYKIYYGIFDTWRNAPIETNCEPWVEYVSWDDRQVNETVNRISYAFPYYDRYGNFNDIKYGFEFFSLPDAHIYYYFHQADYHDSLFLYWKEDIFSTWDFDLNKEVWFKNEHLNVRQGRYNQVDTSTDYSIVVGEDTIKIATKIKAKGFAGKNPDYGVQINYGDYFTLFNSKSDIEVMRDFENRTKLLPPRLENRVLSMMDFTFSTVNDWWLILNLNHEFLNTLWAHFGLNMGFSEREILFSVFSSLFNEFNILSNEQKEILINGIQEAIRRQFHDAGLHGLVDNYHPANGNTVYGVWMFVSTNSISGWYSSITPWDHLQEPDQ